ncbi:MAG: type I-B CRISPR-associated protein Cas7/Csh2 [Ignavibacteriaceae bacterium]|nr:MAG: type I-B CRISPR-associated protein Cas7/Csh2 [Chlorobiota bacterium]GJQ32657.1 MAG: type I-B CRISPR-associated protein Cas7/Csh2 [Ignavibacteriaceae bacterium]
MSNTISKKTELLFVYDIENANPNGDPLNENRPRFDPETNTALVSDVRLKRTVRDYWYEYEGYNGQNGKDIFVRETFYKDDKDPLKSYVKDGKRRATDFNEEQKMVLDTCIDIRVFGGVIPLKNDSITLTGPVQFQMGRSLNKVEIVTEQGTGAFASGEKMKQSTFRTEYKLPYAVIGFNGIINDKAAEKTGMSEDDQKLLIKGIWEGTKSLISRSKFGQKPLLLLAVTFKDSFYLGGLRQKLGLVSEMNEEAIRSTNDYSLDLTSVVASLNSVSDKIASIEVRIDPNLKVVVDGKQVKVREGVTDTVAGLLA